MKNSFAELSRAGNIFTRRWGGTSVGTAVPYISGYFFVWFNSLPTQLASVVSTVGQSKISSNTEIQGVLAGASTSFTTPSLTLNKIEFPGLGGVKYSTPGNLEPGTTISIKFTEFNKTPIYDIISGWVKLIRDYRTGVSSIVDGKDSDYSASAYASNIYYWTTSPDGQTPQYYACYTGCYPMKSPDDIFSSDIENVSKLDVEIEFNVDYAYHEEWVYNKCVGLMSDVFLPSKANVLDYGNKIV